MAGPEDGLARAKEGTSASAPILTHIGGPILCLKGRHIPAKGSAHARQAGHVQAPPIVSAVARLDPRSRRRWAILSQRIYQADPRSTRSAVPAAAGP